MTIPSMDYQLIIPSGKLYCSKVFRMAVWDSIHPYSKVLPILTKEDVTFIYITQ